MGRSLFCICCGRQSNQEEKLQCEDQGHHGPKKQLQQFCFIVFASAKTITEHETWV